MKRQKKVDGKSRSKMKKKKNYRFLKGRERAAGFKMSSNFLENLSTVN